VLRAQAGTLLRTMARPVWTFVLKEGTHTITALHVGIDFVSGGGSWPGVDWSHHMQVL
jgi:hypothetical protein